MSALDTQILATIWDIHKNSDLWEEIWTNEECTKNFVVYLYIDKDSMVGFI